MQRFSQYHHRHFNEKLLASRNLYLSTFSLVQYINFLFGNWIRPAFTAPSAYKMGSIKVDALVQ